MKAVVALLFVASAVLVTSCGKSAAPTARGCRDWIAARDYRAEIGVARRLVARMKRAFAAPGLSVAVGVDGRIVWSESCGLADEERDVPVRRATQFRIGSVSKSLTAAAIARLDQEGRIDVNASIRTYVPEFPAAGKAPTLRQLGGHLGGIRHYDAAETVNTKHYASTSAALRVFINDPLVAPPGTAFNYSSYGFDLLGAAIERATRTSFSNAVASTLLRPLGLSRTTVGRTRAPTARFYEVTNARTARPAPPIDLSDRYPAGGFLSTAEDLVRFGEGITGSTFLGTAARSLLFTSQRTTNGHVTGYGFGFEVGRSPFGRIAGHIGNVVGGTAFLFIHPRTRVVVALTSNIGYVTASTPPSLRGTPDPPQLALPFIRHALRR
jgi:serine beta-lactamase-like protein LACTB